MRHIIMYEALFFINVMTEMGEEHLFVINNELMPKHMFVNKGRSFGLGDWTSGELQLQQQKPPNSTRTRQFSKSPSFFLGDFCG